MSSTRENTVSIAYFPAIPYTPLGVRKMTFGQSLAAGILYGKLKRIEKNTKRPPANGSRIDFDLSYATRNGRVAGALFFVVFVIAAVILIFSGHIFYGLLAAFAALCALLWPFLKQTDSKET
jgi:dolichol kinase